MAKEKDGTEGFEVTSSDLPEADPQEIPEEKTKLDTEGEESLKKDQGEDGKKQDVAHGDDTPAKDSEKKTGSFQKRINKLTREREENRREVERLQRENEKLKSSNKKPEKGKEPVESDFTNYEDYLDALDAYDSSGDSDGNEVGDKKADDKEAESKPEDDHQSELTDSQITAMAVVRELIHSAEKPDDFKDVAFAEDVPISPSMIEALAECENPAKIMYYLGQNKDVAKEIANGTPMQQAREITILDKGKFVPTKPTKTTNAPDPIDPVAGSDAQEKNISDMDFKEYEAKMNERERKGGRGGW